MATAAWQWNTAPTFEHRADFPARVPTAVQLPRHAYRASGRMRPIALAASLGIGGGLVALVGLMDIASPPPARHAPAVISLELLPQAPPPPSAPATPHASVSPPIAVPAPEVPLPAASPLLNTTTTDTPAPSTPAPPTLAPPHPGPPVSAPAAIAAPASGPLDGGDLSGKMIAAPPPAYPIDARRHREQGIVKLALLVGIDGTVDTISVAASSGSYRLDRAALSAVRKWRWSPVVRNGAAVAVRGFVLIPFVLQG